VEGVIMFWAGAKVAINKYVIPISFFILPGDKIKGGAL